MKYRPEGLILIEKVGSDDYVGVLSNAQFLRDQGVNIPESLQRRNQNPNLRKRRCNVNDGVRSVLFLENEMKLITEEAVIHTCPKLSFPLYVSLVQPGKTVEGA